MQTNNPYEVPESVLAEPSASVGGALQSGIRGDYDFTIGEVLDEAWEASKGFKLTFWGALIIFMMVSVALGAVFAPFEDNAPVSAALQIFSTAISYPLSAGLVMLGVYRAAGRQVQATQIAAYFPQIIKIILLNVLMTVLIALGMLLLVLPGLYLAVAYTLAMPLMLEKNLGIWEAMEASRKAITHHWFKFLLFYIVLALIVMAGALLLMIGLVWALPLGAVAMGVLYTRVFGVESE